MPRLLHAKWQFARSEFYAVTNIQGALTQVTPANTKPTWSKFGNLNKFGFLFGILIHTPDEVWKQDYIRDFYWTFGSDRLKESAVEQECLNLLYARFIEPSPTVFDLNGRKPTHSNFKKALNAPSSVGTMIFLRPPICLLRNLVRRSSKLSHVPWTEQVSNRSFKSKTVFLCGSCHQSFDALRRYIEVVDGRLVAKVVNLTTNHLDRQYPASLSPATTLPPQTAAALVSTAEFTNFNHTNRMNIHSRAHNPPGTRHMFINGLPFEKTAFPNLAEKLGFRHQEMHANMFINWITFALFSMLILHVACGLCHDRCKSRLNRILKKKDSNEHLNKANTSHVLTVFS
ncbi:hypothetical protein BJ741DRAFT_574856 [Chytriomyces cf. hyalinus JEL632]|nr:hypothetical protein BJ741DRAFT_574856 [Chytriomyces cf. hyalinus JEL632]